MGTVADIQAEVAEQGTVVDGVVTMLDGISQELKTIKSQLEGAGADTAAIDQIIADLDANTNKLAEAVARNTAANDEAHGAGT